MQQLTVKQVAAELQLHVETVRDLLRDGVLQGSKTSRGAKAHWRISREQLTRYLETK